MIEVRPPAFCATPGRIDGLGVLVALVMLGGCKGSGPTGPDLPTGPLPSTFGRVEVDVAFGDPPFEGELLIIPAAPAGEWTYEVDLDADGKADETGSVGLGVHVGFRYEDPGPHSIRVILDDGSQRYSREELVMVNDPTAVERVREGVLGPESSLAADFGQPALSPAGDRIYVVDHNRKALLQVDLASLTVTRQRDLPFDEGLLQADVWVAEEGDGVYVLMSAPDVTGRWLALSRDLVPVAEPRVTPFAGPFLESGPEGLLYAWGLSGLTLFDPRSLEVIKDQPPDATSDVDLSADGETLLVSIFEPPAVALLDPNSLRRIWYTPLSEKGGLRPWRASFSPDGDKIYVLLNGNSPASQVGLGLAVLDAESGELLKIVGIGRGARSQLSDLVMSADGRFLAFATDNGMYFLDVDLDLPRFRGLGGESVPIACCQVVASTSANTFFVASSQRSSIVEVRLTP